MKKNVNLDKLIQLLGRDFASLTRYTVGRSGRRTYFAESTFLDDGRHFQCEGDTPLEAVEELCKVLGKR
jgi:hypothetical protein